jgi:hypothetical protein
MTGEKKTKRQRARVLGALAIVLFGVAASGQCLASEASDDACPSAVGTRCAEAIRSAVDRASYSEARDLAENQCEAVPATTPEARLEVGALVAQASGCYWLYVLERFLGRPLPATDAKDKAKRIAVLGCDHGLDELCDVLVGMIDRQLDEVLGEVRVTLRKPEAAVLRRASLRSVDGGRELPRAFLARAAARLKTTFAAESVTLADCDACRARQAAATANPDRDAMTAALPETVLDVKLAVSGGDLSLAMTAHDTRTNRVVWERSWKTRTVDERHRLYGFDASVPESVATARRIEEWEPDYHVMAGVGIARLPNTAGGSDDSQRAVIQVRAGERFQARRTEVGMLLSFHVTQRILQKRFGRSMAGDGDDAGVDDGDGGEAVSEEPDETAVPETGSEGGDDASGDVFSRALAPYATSLGLYGYLGRHLTGAVDGYDGFRSGVTLGYGGLLATNMAAPTARLSLELYFGRRFAISPAAIWVGRSVIRPDDGGESEAKAVVGSECVFALNF